LPQLLPTLREGTPAIGIFFNIFIGQHRLESSPSMIEIEHILDQEPVSVKHRDEKFVDPLPDTFADRNVLAWGRSGMAGHDHSHARQSLLT
jgi:hypothetical protein